ncbi:MAG: GNAT family N-acetyltransferase [Anaerolineales bacterium]|nr:GNAT family N-acetyltransferase [Anaerolineales bacterium]
MTAMNLATQLRLRAFGGDADLPAMAALARRANAADNVDERPTVELLSAWVHNLVNADPQEDILLAEVAGALVGYQHTSWRREDVGGIIYQLSGYVDPDWRRQGIGTTLVERGEARLRALAAQRLGDEPRLLSTFTPASRVGKVALFEQRGYRVVRHFYEMLRAPLDDLPPLPTGPQFRMGMPPGFELRPAGHDRPALRAIWEASEEAFRDHWGARPPTEADFQRLLDQPNHDPDLWVVAWDTASGQIAGSSINALAAAESAALGRARGWVQDLSVRRPFRRRGLGRALLLHSLYALRARGAVEAALGVDAENPNSALRLYESVGFKTFQDGLVLRKPI